MAGIDSGAQLHSFRGNGRMRKIDPMRRIEIEIGLVVLLLCVAGCRWFGLS